MTTRPEIQAKLSELPDDPDKIAAFFTKHNIKGARARACECPITRWTGGHATTSHYISFWDEGHYFTEPIPEAVSLFVMRFDRFCYPGLVK